MKFSYVPEGVCSRRIDIELDGDTIKSIYFEGGCNGNGKGIAMLAAGMKIDDYITRCKAIECKDKGTSCPAQLAKALIIAKEKI